MSLKIIGTNLLPSNASRTCINVSINCRLIDGSSQRSRHQERGAFFGSNFPRPRFADVSPCMFLLRAIESRLIYGYGLRRFVFFTNWLAGQESPAVYFRHFTIQVYARSFSFV